MTETTTQTHAHAVIWIDHLIAKVFSIGLTGVSATAVRAHLSSQHLHHKANTIGDGHVQEDSTYLVRVGEALNGCTDLLIMGPGIEKTELKHFLERAHPDISMHLESSDHPTDGEIVALGRKRFRLD